MAGKKKEPNPVDVHVGSRVRLKRIMEGLTQEKLGDELGITFQQVQKYEKGTNRIGSSRLHQIAEILNTPVSFFFEDLQGSHEPGLAEGSASSFVVDFLSTSEGLQLNRSFMKIKDPQVRKRIVDLVRTLSESD